MTRGFERPDTQHLDLSRVLDAQEIKELDDAIDQYDKESPRIAEFQDIRGKIDLQNDQREVDRLRGIFKEKAPNEKSERFERLGKTLELVLLDFSSSWLPGYLSRASEYDDMLNKTDLVLEMQDDNDRTLRIALDVTANSPKTGAKIWEIIKALRLGRLSRLKYFRSQLDDSRDIKYAPRVVIGSDDLDQTRQLARLYLSYNRSKGNTEKRNLIRRAIAEHPIGRGILEQILFQLRRSAGILANADAPQDDRGAARLGP